MKLDSGNKLDELIDFGFSEGSCVLFVGPDLLKYDGADFNSAFFAAISHQDTSAIDTTRVKYHPDEKIWSFASNIVKSKFYIELSKFLKEKTNWDDPVFHQMASLPFPLIVSLLPDDTLSTAFSQFAGLDFTFKSSLESNVPEPGTEHPVIYNIYGNTKNREYVVSHFDYLTFIERYAKEGFPLNIKESIAKANYMVFVGFEFDRWYNIFLLYIINKIKDRSDKIAISAQSAEELYQNLLDMQSLNVFFNERESTQFLQELYTKAKGKGLARNLISRKDYFLKMLGETQLLINEVRERIQLTDPVERRKLELDLQTLEKEKKEWIHQIEKIHL
jgi:hypothetical protein